MSKILDENDVIKAAISSRSMSDILDYLKLSHNGKYTKQIKDILAKNNIPVPSYTPKRKWELFKKVCPVCQTEFESTIGNKNEKTTCSYACSNTHFRSGINAPNYKQEKAFNYRSFMKKEGKLTACEKCGYDKFVEVLHVHHIDRNHKNTDIKNLAVLCPTCHAEDHFLAKDGFYYQK